jgi:hypothetical protein
MFANRETPAALQFVRPLFSLGRPAHVQCRFFLSGSLSSKRFQGINNSLNGSLKGFARSIPAIFPPLWMGEAPGGAV